MGDCDLVHTSNHPRNVTIPPPLRGTSLYTREALRPLRSQKSTGAKNRRKLRCRGAQCAPVQLNDSARFYGRTLFAPTAHIRSDVGGGVLDAPANTRTCRADIESAPTHLKIWPRRGQTVGRRKSVKKNAALLHFLAFSSNDHPFGVPRGRAPWAGVRCLGTARLFSLPFLVTKKEGLTEEAQIKRETPQGGVSRRSKILNSVSCQQALQTPVPPARSHGCSPASAGTLPRGNRSTLP